MISEYSENRLVQDSAGDLLRDELGWEVKYAYNTEDLGENGTFGRKSYKEVLLTRYFTEALKRLNSWITQPQIDEAKKILEEVISTNSLIQTNEEKYRLLRDGIPVTVKTKNGQTNLRKASVIDFQNPDNNHFLAIKELKIHGDLYRRRTDIVGFVNGLPLLFIELKKFNVDVQNAYTDNYCDYLDNIPQLFIYNAFIIFSNGTEAKVGTLGSKYEFFHEWKRLKEAEPGSVALETMLRGICNKRTFLDLFENYILFDHEDCGTIKILARNHQYLGVNEAIKAYSDRKLRNGKLGVFWHTQGSGKSYSMVFLAQKIRRKLEGSPTIVVLTDRDELNTQICQTFSGCGLLESEVSQYIASSANDLENKLRGNPSFIFTLIQKFNHSNPEPIHCDHDVLIMSDEAHRSQYGFFAENMLQLLPEASRIGFTGTPLLKDDELTKQTFGGYISIYDFKRAVEDGATVPLYYENRSKKFGKVNPDINQALKDAIEAADLDVNQQDKLEHEFSKEIHLLMSDERLKIIAQDFVHHYSGLWTSGKAMFVCLNKVSCVRMYNYVQEYWKDEIKNVEEELKHATQQEAQELTRKLSWLKETEMNVVVSQEQNEIQTFQKWGLDIRSHRIQMEKRDLAKDFKNAEHPFRIVFVCAMWLTGFDVKTLSCLYLDKPLKEHTLMQTIARANRVADGKSNGLIIDYIGIVKALQQAIADYTAKRNTTEGVNPTVDKEKLLARIVELITTAETYLKQRGFNLTDLISSQSFEKLALLEATNSVCDTLESKKKFSSYVAELKRLIRYCNREEISEEIRAKKNALIAIYQQLQEKRKHADNTDLMVELNAIINQYVEMESGTSRRKMSPIDLSKLNVTILQKEFARIKHKFTLIKDLSDVLENDLQQMLEQNPNSRPCIDFYEKFQKIIEDYNSNQDKVTIEKTFSDLMELATSLDTERQRYVREGFQSVEELAMYELLFKKELSKAQIAQLKKVAVELLNTIKTKIQEFDHWTEKQDTRAEIQRTIRDLLYNKLPDPYENTVITDYTQKVFEYVFTRYKSVV